METISTSEKIKRLEQELSQLRKQERTEKEEARKKATEEADKELTAIKNAIKAFNDKHGESICLAALNCKTGRDLWNTFFPWIME